MEGLATEVQLTILAFAGPRSAAVFGGCNRAAHRLVTEGDEVLFRPPTFAQRFVSAAGPCSSVTDADNQRAIVDLKRCLELESWRDMWETAAHIIRPPWVGYFRAVPTEPFETEEDTRGVCLAVSPDWEERSLCIRFFVDGGWTEVCWAGVVKDRGGLRLDHRSVGMFSASMRVEYLFPEAEGAGSGSDGPVMRLSSCHTSGAQTTSPLAHYYHPLFHSSVPAALAPADPALELLFGNLWVGTYGPHGDEVLLLRMVRLEEEEEGAEGGEGGLGRVVCEGIKITGDPNVPAGKWSFRVALDRPRDMAEAIASDPRRIYTMRAGPIFQNLRLNLEEEMQAGLLYRIYPGQGQINRVPLSWNPETVGVDLVVWKENARRWFTFGLVWHDDDHAVRHCITFRRIPNDYLEAWMGKLGE